MGYYEAIATLTDGCRTWDVTIYSHYLSVIEAAKDVERFASHGYNIVSVRIIPNE